MVMTTNVTHRRPHRMPWTHRDLYYDPARLRRLFPERIVAWMDAHPPPAGEGREGERRERRLAALAPLRPFPAADDLPVVVAARMSLSFPLLISAVPLHALDMTRRADTARRRGRRGRRASRPSRSPPRSAGSRTAGSRATSRSTSSTRRSRRGRRSRSTSTGSTPTTAADPDEADNVYLPVDERRRPARDVAPARTGAGLREPQRVRQRDRAHDAEPRRLGAHPAAGLPGPDRARPHGARTRAA